jgi:hypothetical protein
MALLFCLTSYIILSYLAQNLFGTAIEVSLFDNMKQDSGVLSIGVRALFLIIFLCNIPYLFFPGKMSILNALLEYREEKFSRVLQRNIENQEKLLAKADQADFGGSELNFSEINDDNGDDEIDVMNECDDKTYYIVTFAFLFAICAAALSLDDLSLIFGMIAAFSESMLNFVLPGLFYMTGLAFIGDNDRPIAKLAASLFTFIGLAYFVISNYFNYVKFMRVF